MARWRVCVQQGLLNTDQRVAQGKPVTPTFLFALLLYGPIAEIIEKQPQEKWHDIGTIVDAVDRAARAAQGRISIPKRFSLGVREMFAAQPRLEQPRGRRALRMLEQPRFRAGFDLLLLRADMGLADPARSPTWWTRVQEVSQTDRDRMADAFGGQPRPAGEGGGAAPASAPPPAWPRPRTCGLMNAAPAGLAQPGELPRWLPAYVAIGSNLDDPRRQVERAFEALSRAAAVAPGAALTAVSHRAFR